MAKHIFIQPFPPGFAEGATIDDTDLRFPELVASGAPLMPWTPTPAQLTAYSGYLTQRRVAGAVATPLVSFLGAAGLLPTAGGPAGSTGVNKYVVSNNPAVEAAYLTVQSAIDAAVADGATAANPAAVVVLPGTYTENITIADGVSMWGSSGQATTQTPDAGASIVQGTVTISGPGSFFWSGVDVNSLVGVALTVTGTGPRVFISDCTVQGQGALSHAGTGGVPFVFGRDVGFISTDATPAVSSTAFGVILLSGCFCNAASDTGLAADISAGVFQLLMASAAFGVVRTTGTASLGIRAGDVRSGAVAGLDLNGSGTHLIFNGAVECSATPAVTGTATVRVPDIIWPGSGHGFAPTITVDPVGGITAGPTGMVDGNETGVRDPSAVLDLQSQISGFLPPRMTGAQADAIAAPADGLMLYCSDAAGPAPFNTGPGLFVRDAGAWKKATLV